MRGAGAKVLFIDDDEGLRRLVKRSLERRGYVVSLASSGAEGVALAAREPFDVIALDHYMPGQDGLATLEVLREQPNAPPIVYVTGSDESRVAVAALKAGAADYVVKVLGDEFFDLLESAFHQALEQVRLRREKTDAEAALRASNARLEVLLREVNHRVANSLQLVSAFVQLQAQALDDAASAAALRDTQNRIEAIIQVHRRLYTSDDVEAVDMAAYLTALVQELQEAWSSEACPRPIRISAEPIRLGTDKAVSVGVIVNELVSNACKYAYPPNAPGEVRVSFRRAGEGKALLEVEDDGRGMSPAAPPQGTGLGARVIRAMAASLDSRVEYSPGPGVRASLLIAL